MDFYCVRFGAEDNALANSKNGPEKCAIQLFDSQFRNCNIFIASENSMIGNQLTGFKYHQPTNLPTCPELPIACKPETFQQAVAIYSQETLMQTGLCF